MEIAVADIGESESESAGRRPRAWAALLLTSALAWSLALRHHAPYQGVPRSAQTMALHEVFPRFGRLYGTPGLWERMSELRTLIDDYAIEPGLDFSVLRSHLLAHFLTGTQNPVGLDWYSWLEMRGHEQALTRELMDFNGILIIERSAFAAGLQSAEAEPAPCTSSEFASSPFFLQRIYDTSQLVSSGWHFCVIDRSDGATRTPR